MYKCIRVYIHFTKIYTYIYMNYKQANDTNKTILKFTNTSLKDKINKFCFEGKFE